ncbi:MAG: hypothetical protein SFW36_00885 [Leptolyngbyaceae cyanobacterium bins.59]|nr:hypothetical protein [Leptolyngbyaceae cyanobacterium bins.59]
MKKFDFLYLNALAVFLASSPYLTHAAYDGPGTGMNWVQPWKLRLGLILVLPAVLAIVSPVLWWIKRHRSPWWATTLLCLSSLLILLYVAGWFAWFWILSRTRFHI